MSQQDSSLSYKDAGVDIDAGQALVERIKSAVKRTQRPEVMGGLGGFGGLFQLPTGYREPVLVSGTDGVGTKLRLAIESGQHHHIGIDLVAMCVNDIAVTGAEPLFFLDYYATGQLDVDVASQVVRGIARGCEQAGCALVGGETAEMPGMYHEGDYDLAGFAVGIVEKNEILDGGGMANGDLLIGLASSGPHSNGYSLIRRILERSGTSLDQRLDDRSLGEHLLAPTRIYVNALQQLLREVPVRALSHITGGGLLDNLPRVLPEHCAAHVDTRSWRRPVIFDWLQEQGRVEERELYRTFNCGVGMVAVVPASHAQRALQVLREGGEDAFVLGEITAASGDQRVLTD